MSIKKKLDTEILFLVMKLRAINTTTLVMNEFGQVTSAYRHFREFGTKIPILKRKLDSVEIFASIEEYSR